MKAGDDPFGFLAAARGDDAEPISEWVMEDAPD
jgi:hypothetical protein